MSGVTTHVLDQTRGGGAGLVKVTLAKKVKSGWQEMAWVTTDSSGRARMVEQADKGTWRLSFATAAYFKKKNERSFWPEVEVIFEIVNPKEHYHVPLLLGPWGYSTYRGV